MNYLITARYTSGEVLMMEYLFGGVSLVVVGIAIALCVGVNIGDYIKKKFMGPKK